MRKTLILLVFLSLSNKIQSQPWQALPGGSLDWNVYSAIRFGPYMWFGGIFTMADTIYSPFVVRHDGTKWVYTPSTNGVPKNFCVYNNELYALGEFSLGIPMYGIMKWNGTGWTPMAQLPSNSYINDGVEYNGELIVGGRFSTVDGLPIEVIAKWNGSSWDSLASGSILSATFIPEVTTLLNAKGCLYVGGYFSEIYGTTTANVVKFCEGTITAIPLSENIPQDLYYYRSDVYVSGSFSNAGTAVTKNIAKEDTISVGSWLKISPTDDGVQLFGICLGSWNNKLYISGTIQPTSPGSYIGKCGYWDGSTWTQDDIGLNSPNSYGVKTYTDQVSNVLYSMGAFNALAGDVSDYVAYKSFSPLPVEFGYLTTHCNEKEQCIELKWLTYSEHDNLRFIIERSFDGSNFYNIATVDGNGTTNDVHNYEYCDYYFTDGKNKSSKVFYRLKQIDYSGEENNLGITSTACFLLNKPNIYTEGNDVVFDINSPGVLTVNSVVGNELIKIEISKNTRISLEYLPQGIYLLFWRDIDGFYLTKKLARR